MEKTYMHEVVEEQDPTSVRLKQFRVEAKIRWSLCETRYQTIKFLAFQRSSWSGEF